MSFLREIGQEIGRLLTTREAAGALSDPDDYQYRLVSGGNTDQPNDLRQDAETKLRRIARTYYFTNAIGGSLVDSLVARVLGAGIAFKADERVMPEVTRFVQDPDNDLDIQVPRMATELLAFGKLVLPISLNPQNADVKLGYLHPDQVERIVWRQGDAKKAVAVIQCRPAGHPDKPRYCWIVPHKEDAFGNRYAPHPALTAQSETGSVAGLDGNPVIVPDDEGLRKLIDESHGDIAVAGYAFYERTHCLVGGDGHSIFERVKDEIKAFGDFFFGQLRNAKLQSAFVWDVLLKGADEAKIKARREQSRKEGPPQPGSVLFRNGEEEWEAKGPTLPNAAAVKELVTSTLKLIGLAVGLPGHEMGAEDDVNRSTAKESRSVSLNKAKRFQRELAAILQRWLAYQIDQKIFAGQLPELSPAERKVEATLPELDGRDETEAADALQKTVPALVAALADGLVLKRDARRKMYELLGYDLPADAEFEAEDREREEKQAQDANDRLAGIIDQIDGTKPVGGPAATGANGARIKPPVE